MKYKFALWSIMVAFLATGCKNGNSDPQPIIDKRTQQDLHIDQQFSGQWMLTRIRSYEPIDANLDGIPSTDLMAEIPYHAYVYSVFKVNWGASTDQRKMFSDGFVRTYLENEDGSGTNNYAVNGRLLFFDIDENRTRISLTDEKGTKTYPMQINLMGQLIIEGIERTYYTKGGWILVPTISTYERAK